jgi:sulfatase maturation enzyme AslB (radical SAM superfamily)
MSKTYCNHINKGMFVSHQGVRLCCVNNDTKNIKPSEFWGGDVRKDALSNMEAEHEVKGCDICYKTESRKMPSSRTFANSYDRLPVKKFPTMLDVDLSNFCNLKCVMCGPTRSSEWAKTLGLPVSSMSYDLIDDLANISGDLQHLTIQGGEPTIMKEYEYYFSLLKEKGIINNIDLQMITNATNINKRFYDLLTEFKSVRLSISIDAYGLANDYIRWPSKFKQIEKNLIEISNLPNNVQIELLNSLNVLSMFNYYKFLKWCKKIEVIFEEKKKIFRIVPMKVQIPKKYSPFLAPLSLKEKFTNDVKIFMKESNLTHNSNWRTEMMLLVKQINTSLNDDKSMDLLKDTIKDLDLQRNKKITNYIPDIYDYI